MSWTIDSWNKIGLKEASEKYHIPKSTLAGYRNHFQQSPTVPIAKGRPKALTAEAEKHLVDYLIEHKDYKPNLKQYNDKVKELIDLTAEQRGQAYSKEKMSKRTLDKIEIKLNIATGKGESTPNARKLAVESERNAISFAVMNYLIEKSLHRSMILNADATQFTVGCNTATKQVTIKYMKQNSKEK